MPVWAWIIIVAIIDALCWGAVLHRVKQRLEISHGMHHAFTSELRKALEAPKGDREVALRALLAQMSRRSEGLEKWRG